MRNVGDEDVVGIGTDFDGFTTPQEDLDSASKMQRLTQRLVVDGHSFELPAHLVYVISVLARSTSALI